MVGDEIETSEPEFIDFFIGNSQSGHCRDNTNLEEDGRAACLYISAYIIPSRRSVRPDIGLGPHYRKLFRARS